MDPKQKIAIIKDFVKYAQNHLGIQKLPNIVFTSDHSFALKNHSFGSYNPEFKELYVYINNRNLADVLRTLAHELVHHAQYERNENMDGQTGSDIENEANALAGIMMRNYGKENEIIYEGKKSTKLKDILIEVSKKKYKLYFDIDDTLTNYTERLKKLKKGKSSDTVEDVDFWKSAEWLPGAKAMLDFALKNFEDVEFLSSIPNPDKYKAPSEGKFQWIKDNGYGHIKANWSVGGKNKARWARPNTILIDDKPENIQAFEKAGGIGILIKDPKNVIKTLKKYI